jgi:hypothetical protein
MANWDVAFPNWLFIHVRDLFASGLCGKGGLDDRRRSVELGIGSVIAGSRGS